MATEKQIAANRANSKRSTGPKTKIGRLKSCRSALRRGLSCASPMNAIEVETIAQALATVGVNDERLITARELAQTELELVRIRRVRGQMLASLLQCCHPHQVKRLAALDLYERSALAKRKRASVGVYAKLAIADKRARFSQNEPNLT
jgi:hypothetical protein